MKQRLNGRVRSFYCPEQGVKRLKTLAGKKEKATTPSGKTYVLTKTKDYVKPSLAFDYKKAVSDFGVRVLKEYRK